jgi:hypothetical protein
LPKTLICDTPLTTLPRKCQIAFDEDKKQFKIVTENGNECQISQTGDSNNEEDDDFQSVASTTNLQDIQDAQNVRVQEIIGEHRLKHQDMLKYLRQKVKYLRALERAPNRGNEACEKMLKEKWADAKKKLRQFRDDEDDDDIDVDVDVLPGNQNDEPLQEPPKKKAKRKKEYGENKSRCSDHKVKFFSDACLQLQREDELGLRQSWESVYKAVMNDYKALDGKDSESEKKKIDLQIPKYSTLLTNLKYCRVWRKARNNASIEQV